MSRIQLKIMAALTGLVLVVVGSVGLLAERGLRERTTANIRDDLEHQAQLVRHLMGRVTFDTGNAAELREIARASAKSTEARITLIDPSGVVLADSDVPDTGIADISNQSDRPEVIGAIRDGIGQEMRRSSTLKRTLLYVAVRVPEDSLDGRYGVVRLAVYLDQLDAAVGDLRRELLVAGGIGLVAALGLSFVISFLSLRPIRELHEVVGDIAAGKLDRRLSWGSQDERGEIASAINQLARQMRESIETARNEKVRLEAVLSSMVEGVIVIDNEGKVLLVNPRGRELLSIWGDYAGRSVPEIIRSPEIDQALRDAEARDELVVREIRVQTHKQRTLLMHASGFPDDSPRAGTVAVFHDVTELRRVDEVRRDFIANASHELRTPLTSIRGFADTLSSSKIPEEDLPQYLEVIVRNAERMSDLIDDLLTLSRIEAGTSELEIVGVDIGRSVEMLIAEFAPRFKEASIEVRLHAEAVPACLADRGAFDQVMSNLLSNAARYSNAGSTVDVSLDVAEEHVQISVADTGIGIPAEDLERIFERFYRVDAARSRALGSTGLGLSIVKHLVRAMRSDIQVESELGKGTTFSFRLPIA